tara:strand:- start:310 stop:1185 length:876 start_codon:yes stop_codon:yes gene_type:complete
MFYDEEMLLDIRLNILNKFVDQFIIVESTYSHSGQKRDLIFNIDKYKKFKDKIKYFVSDKKPREIETVNSYDTNHMKENKTIMNAVWFENSQRNAIINPLTSADPNDQIIISDLDEIPNLENINFKNIKNKLILFKQKMFYYKFNLILDNMTWCGSKSCKKKDLLSPQWLREVKDKKYPLWRIDTYFSKKKHNDIFFVNKGGWHFTNIKTPEEIDKKLRSYLHHPEYEKSKIGPKEISEMIKKKQPVYDLTANSSETKDRSRSKLKISSLNELPIYIQQNKEKFNEWIVSN